MLLKVGDQEVVDAVCNKTLVVVVVVVVEVVMVMAMATVMLQKTGQVAPAAEGG